MQDKRRHRRTLTDEPARLFVQGVGSPSLGIPGRVKDISESGVFIETDLAIRTGQRLFLELRLGGNEVMRVEGRVAWTGRKGDQAGCGVEILPHPPAVS